MFFCFIIFIILLIFIVISTLKITIEFKNVLISTEKKENKYLNNEYKITIYIYVLGKIRIKTINATQEKLNKLNFKSMNLNLFNSKENFEKFFKQKIKKFNIDVEKLDLKIEIGTENAALTAFAVTTIASFIGIWLRNVLHNDNDKKFIVTPIYLNKNVVNTQLDCILTISLKKKGNLSALKLNKLKLVNLIF